MSLPMGRGSMQVRSCGLVRKRDGTGRAVNGRHTEEREISASFISVLLSRYSRREQHSHGN
jgi:hypothetical protein